MSSTSREIILGKVRSALEKKAHLPHEPEADDEVFFFPKNVSDIELFKERFIANKGLLFEAKDQREMLYALTKFLVERGLTRIWVRESEIQLMLDEYAVAYKASLESLSSFEVSITTCDYLIARTGSMLVTSAGESGRELSILAPIHIVIAKTSQIVEDIQHGLHNLRVKYAGDLPSMISLTTGPSRTADIEKTLVLGAHGPKELVLFLLHEEH